MNHTDAVTVLFIKLGYTEARIKMVQIWEINSSFKKLENSHHAVRYVTNTSEDLSQKSCFSEKDNSSKGKGSCYKSQPDADYNYSSRENHSTATSKVHKQATFISRAGQ